MDLDLACIAPGAHDGVTNAHFNGVRVAHRHGRGNNNSEVELDLAYIG
jgi:hypothetical protein